MSRNTSFYEEYQEPNIRKAKFIVTEKRIYTLEFDQNITMEELKLMIQKAAHLRKNKFRLFNNGIEYTSFNTEIFDSLFENQKLVVFTLEILKGGSYDETEYLLQMNCPCSEHIDKFLIYYCYTCNMSICSECFTNGSHKGHRIQDKCFYLLPSKFLVEKLFEGWSQNPYQDYQLTENKTLIELKQNITTIMFNNIFKLLNDLQSKFLNIIEKYHFINITSNENIRSSVRDIKISCIKILDNLKEKMDIKEIINNDTIFIDFDNAYKRLGKLQQEKFQQNIFFYNEYNRNIPGLVSSMINDFNNDIINTLNKINQDIRFQNIINQIQSKGIKPINQEEITHEINIYVNKDYKNLNKNQKGRYSLNFGLLSPVNNFSKNSINLGKKSVEPKDFSSVSTLQHNVFDLNKINFDSSNKNVLMDFNLSKKKELNNSVNDIFNTSNILNKNDSFVNTNSKILYNSLLDTNINNNISNNIFNTDIINKYPLNQKINKESSTQTNIINFQTPEINLNTNLLNKEIITKKTVIEKNIIYDNNNPINSNANLFSLTLNNNIDNNDNINKLINTNIIPNTTFTSNKNINVKITSNTTNDNLKQNIDSFSSAQPTRHQIKSTNEILSKSNDNQLGILTNQIIRPKVNNLINESFFLKNESKNINQIGDIHNDNFLNSSNIVKNSKIVEHPMNQKVITDYMMTEKIRSGTNNIILNSNNVTGINQKLRITTNHTIQEESTESENEKFFSIDKKKILNSDFILAPAENTNIIKILTSLNNVKEITLPLTFSEDMKIYKFLEKSAYCNYLKILYISGGKNNQNKNSNIFLSINLNEEKKIKLLSPMIENRNSHSLIGFDHFIIAVGGENNNTVEKYDLYTDKWEKIKSMHFIRMNPILCIYNSYLYVFFGKQNNEIYCNSVERINLRNEIADWELVKFRNLDNINLNYCGCAVYLNGNILFFFGGKLNDKITNTIFSYNFESSTFVLENNTIENCHYFNENKLHPLAGKLCQISADKFCGVYYRIRTGYE